jgi:hypothetical protein
MWLHVGTQSSRATCMDNWFFDSSIVWVRYCVRCPYLERVRGRDVNDISSTDSACFLLLCRGQRTKKTEQVEKKLRKALGMSSHEGSIDENEKSPAMPSPTTDTRSSGESYNNGDVGRDSQRLLPDSKTSATVAPPEDQNQVRINNSREEYEMRETRKP